MARKWLFCLIIISFFASILVLSTFVFAETVEQIASIENEEDGRQKEIEKSEWQKNVIEPMGELSDKARNEKGELDLDKYIEVAEKDRIYANEETVFTSLSTLSTAFQVYRSVNGAYPKTLLELSNAKPPYIPSFLNEEDSHMGYKYRIGDSSQNSYLIMAYPDPSTPPEFSGRYSFCVTEDGLVRVGHENKAAASYDTCRSLPAYKTNGDEQSVFMKDR